MSIIDYNTSPLILNFNSDERSGGSNSNFVSTPQNLGFHDYDSVALIQTSIPRSFYNIPSSSSFTVIQNSIPVPCSIPVGSYNKYTLRSTLQTQLNAISDGRIYSVVYNTSPDIFKYVFSFTGGTGNVSFTFTSSLYKQLGFDRNSTNVFSSSELKSTNCINLSLYNKCFIKSNIIQDSNDDILIEVFSYGSFSMLSYCYYSPPILESNIKVFNANNINSWNFSLCDVDGNLIELNEISWGVSLMLFKKQILYDLHKNELNIVNQERLYNISIEKEKIMNSIQDNKDDNKDDKKNEDDNKDDKKVDPTLMENNDNLELYPYTEIGSTVINTFFDNI